MKKRPSKTSKKSKRQSRQDARNWAVFTVLLSFVVLVFAITILKMGV